MVGAINFSYFGRLRVCYRTQEQSRELATTRAAFDSPQHITVFNFPLSGYTD